MRTRKNVTERGAVAVIVAISSTMIFGLAAIAVDLGNAHARKSDVQTQVDLAALAAAAKLPADSAAAENEARLAAQEYLVKNWVWGQDEATWDLADPDLADGWLEFLSPTDIRLHAPNARVNFGLAGAIGADGMDVTAVSRVKLGSPGRPTPFFLPQDCSLGRQEIKHGAQAPEPPVTFPATDPDGPNGSSPDPGVVDPLEVDQEDPAVPPATEISIEGKKFGTNVADLSVRFSRDDKSWPLPPGPAAPAKTLTINGSNATITVDVPDEVLAVAGSVWYVRVKNASGWSKESQALTLTVKSPATVNPGCGVKVEGDFGLLDSPRDGFSQLADRLRLNLSEGIDHNLDPWPLTSTPPPPTGDKACQPTSSPVPGAVLDLVSPIPPSSPNPNCVNILNGNKVDMLTDGLVTDPGARLQVPTTPGCDRNGGSATQTVLMRQINADVLSCFLKPGINVGDVSRATAPAADAITPAIFDSPRFMWVPMINTPINPSNGFYPIVEYRGVFITDETTTSMKGSSTANTINGINDDGHHVTSVSAVAIHPDSLPASAPSYSGPIGPYNGVTAVFRMVE
ncbi:MAG: hypothetical protein GEU96_13110 [Propionibacteriales bacterium]|nr:hypothetical protein [Propionibacteriales bacterium]